MSMRARVELEIRDLDELKAACVMAGHEFREGTKRGCTINGTITVTESQTGMGFVLSGTDMGRESVNRVVRELRQAYSTIVHTKKLQSQGYTVRQKKVIVNGRPKVKLYAYESPKAKVKA